MPGKFIENSLFIILPKLVNNFIAVLAMETKNIIEAKF